MHFTIITPSFNQLDYLKRCITSIADQAGDGITVHHHVQDGGSTDGTVEFLREYQAQNCGLTANSYSFNFSSERDDGMYDALNRGIQCALKDSGYQAPYAMDVGRSEASSFQPSTANRGHDSVVAWLNCDEQYLPKTLMTVACCFSEIPSSDILTGDVLLVDEEGGLLAYRKGFSLRRVYVETSHLYTLSCATFFRLSVFEQVEAFNTTFKAAADEDLIVRALKAGFRAKHVHHYFSTFTFTGENLGASKVAEEEHKILKQDASVLFKLFRIPINVARWFEKVSSGAYFQRFPLEYSIYVGGGSHRRKCCARWAAWKWPSC
jgi:glycosyltransferase involved in cell wall biosynthesis